MKRLSLFTLPLVTFLFLLPVGSSAAAKSDKRDADAILADYAAVKDVETREARTRVAELAKELYDGHPEHPRAEEILAERWFILATTGKTTEVVAETEQFLKDRPDSPQKVDVLFQHAYWIVRSTETGEDQTRAREATERYIEAKPGEEFGARLLFMLAERDKTKSAADFRRIAKDFGDTDTGKIAVHRLRRMGGVGQPFALAFTDAVSGKQISMADLKGKVVVVDFWATWCGPCKAEMPEMKRLYADYKDKGVEFIGVSLDLPEPEGGLADLKEFCKKERISWPQYYQGDGWKSEFSAGWGVNSIPCVFIIAADGKLHSAEARGQLPKLISELIAKRDEQGVGDHRGS